MRFTASLRLQSGVAALTACASCAWHHPNPSSEIEYTERIKVQMISRDIGLSVKFASIMNVSKMGTGDTQMIMFMQPCPEVRGLVGGEGKS